MFFLKNGFKKVGTVVLVNVVLFILLIVLAECLSFFLNARLPSWHIESNYRIHHRWKPNSKHVESNIIKIDPDFPEPFTYVFNNQGWLESYDIAKKKSKKTYRIFYVGDSFTEGFCPMDKSVASIVEQHLNQQANDRDITFEVINTGTPSYSPVIFYVLVRYYIMQYSPDLIVANVDMTDDFDDWKYSQNMIRDDAGNPFALPPRKLYKADFIDTVQGAVKATLWRRLELYLFQNSHIYSLITKLRKRKLQTAPQGMGTKPEPDKEMAQVYQRWAWCQEKWDNETEENVANTLDNLRRLARFCDDKGVKLMLTAVPHYWQYAGSSDGSGEPSWSSRPHYAIAELAKEMKVPYLNSYKTLKPFIPGTPQKKYYYAGDMHLNPRGNAIWARAHIQFLTDKEHALLPEVFN
jgi:hypothetical protein